MKRWNCPTCAASIEPSDAGKADGATCPYCGTESRARHGDPNDRVSDDREIPAPESVPSAPPQQLDRHEWTFEQWIGALLHARDDDRRVDIAETMPAFQEDELVWAPLLADLMIGANRRLDVALGSALGRLASTWNSVPLRGQVMRVVQARRTRLIDSQGVVIALDGVGVAGLKTLLEIASEAERRGATHRVDEILQPIWGIVDRQSDPVAATCLDILLDVVIDAEPACQRFLVHYIADCVDSRYEVSLSGPRDHRDFRFLIPRVARFVDEQLEAEPDLVNELLAEVELLHTYHSKSLTDARDWRTAAALARSDRARATLTNLVRRLYPDDSPFALDPTDSPPPHNERPDVLGEVVAEVIDGRARCPTCGGSVPIRGTRQVVACESCARPVRLPPGLRTELEGREFKDEIEHWSEGELIAALRSESDVVLRRAIAAELDSARTHGSRYVHHVTDLVDQFIEGEDERVTIHLEGAMQRMVASGGLPFRDALLDAVRKRPAARAAPRLLRSLGAYGEASLDLLLELGSQSFAKSTEQADAVAHGSVAFGAVGAALAASGYAADVVGRLLAQIMTMPTSHDDQGAWQTGEQAAQQLGQLFLASSDDASLEPQKEAARGEILRFLDARIEPSSTRYTGLAPRPGCALFSDVGGPTGVGRLIGFIESLWENPATTSDLARRVDRLTQVKTDEIRLVILCSITKRPADLTDVDAEPLQELVTRFVSAPHLAPAAEAVLTLLRDSTPAQGAATGRTPPSLGWAGRLRNWLSRRN